ncbi:MAG: CUB domain-containing protein [Flavobacteriales bacterium]|nr:CUB domain-containing protein [Flavobacteriales bacterium]
MIKGAALPVLLVSACLLSVRTTTAQCGTTVYDTGGPGGNYANNQDLSWTYCAPPGQVITLNFTQFSIELNYDFLTIHDGPGTSSPILAGYTGTGAIPPITSTGSCLTLWFTSDFSGTLPGWTANITCSTPPPVPGGCTYMLSLFDSYGDGWGSSNVGVSINGGPNTFYTVGTISNQVPITLNTGDVVVLTYNNSGPFQGENSYTFGLPGYGPFFDSGTPPGAGISFTQTVACTPPPTPPQDCSGGITICGSQAINNNSTNTGNMFDLNATNRGCLQGGERQGTWYYFSPSASGTVAFTIQPTANVDYDFAIWGPMSTVTCPPTAPPVRCSWAYPPNVLGYPGAGAFLTGMRTTSVDPSEADGPLWAVDGFTSALNVIAGQVYIMYIDNFDNTGQAFNLGWSLTNGASLDCTVLPVGEVALNARPNGSDVVVEWTTNFERGSERFTIERSSDGVVFQAVGMEMANGNTEALSAYTFLDKNAPLGVDYYRIRSTGSNGAEQYSPIVSVLMTRGAEPVLAPNPVANGATLFMHAPTAGTIELRTIDASGRTVHRHMIAMEEGAQQVPLEWPGLDAGAYILLLLDPRGGTLARTPFVRE